MALANRYRQRIVTFTTELEGLVPSYGDLIAITHDMAKWGQGGEVVEKNGLTLSLSEPVQFETGQPHYLALRKKNGSLSGLYVVTAGSLKTEIILSEEPDMDILTGTDAERTHFAFGTADKWSETYIFRLLRQLLYQIATLHQMVLLDKHQKTVR